MANLILTGKWDWNTRVELQRWLKYKGGKYYKGIIDGDIGPLTKKAWQRELKRTGHYTGLIDGYFGPMSLQSLYRFLTKQWGTSSAVSYRPTLYHVYGAANVYVYIAPWDRGSSVNYHQGALAVDQLNKCIQQGLNRYGV